MRSNFEDDDNRVIADMSEVGGKFRKKLFISNNKKDKQASEKLSAKNTFAAIMGSLTASLLIGIIYITIFGLFILIMYMIFKNKLGN